MPSATSTFARLKTRHRAERAAQPTAVALRIHRALSWFGRAEAVAAKDMDHAFIACWIAFNALYADESLPPAVAGERGNFERFFRRLLLLDARHRIFDAIWDRFSGNIRMLLANRYVFQPYWSHHNGVPGHDDWEQRLAASERRIGKALAAHDTLLILTTLFDRLYVLRNQVLHGGATWNGKVNRQQIGDGSRILMFLVPVFIEIMMEHPERDWGAPFYPVVEEAVAS